MHCFRQAHESGRKRDCERPSKDRKERTWCVELWGEQEEFSEADGEGCAQECAKDGRTGLCERRVDGVVFEDGGCALVPICQPSLWGYSGEYTRN